MADNILDLTHTELDALIQRVEEAIEHEIALTPSDCNLLLNALLTLATIQEKLQEKSVTVNKLKKLLGLIRSSEKLRDLAGTSGDEKDNTDSNPQKKKKPRPKNKPASRAVKPKLEHHKLLDQKKGDLCQACGVGTLGKYMPKEFIRIEGQSPFQATQHIQEQLKCTACGVVITAPLPCDVEADGDQNQKYGYSARTMMALDKYFGGTPFNRKESLQHLIGVPISASTIFDQVEYLANDLNPIFKYIKLLAADAWHFFQDDTGHRIIEQKPIMKPDKRTGKLRLRSGVYASGLIASLPCGHDVFLFNTNIGHAGEWLDEILQHRTDPESLAVVMSDALSNNHTHNAQVLRTLCNAHARREFVEQFDNYRDDVEPLLQLYKQIWMNDSHCEENAYSPMQRQQYHFEHSLPVMQAIKQCCETALNDHVEENGGLGKAMKYFTRHYDKLIGFCRIEGAQLDNNRIERTLKLIIRGRKNSYFYKTATGAAISDVITSMIATAYHAGINTFDYFNAVQRFQDQVKANPESWLPWNYASENSALLAV